MSLGIEISVLQRLRRRRRPLGWFLAALALVALVGGLGQCLVMDGMPLAGMAPERAGMPGEMPCGDCTAGRDVRTLAEVVPAPPDSLKPAFHVALVVVSTLLALGFPLSIPIPPRPLLPKRPRTLEFAVLRI